ncbi:hypothetical protein GCM10011583_04420 [Streptomyces camponoticapitis]|uniref:Secreted protein n=1 Tax=Streptomyces camponoticapitis TaxID=1616125 RepID=A0ABQ2DZC7_9ACTN|nr:hypothetical protein [Streptomyces camponoticapitis]GGJ76141.1 hypothetical protein GCM10011583_04420 [Streptomyces camponoticapitis]
MTALLPLLLVVGCLAAVMGFFGWLALLVRRRGSAGAAITAAMASYDEAFRVTAHEAHYEIQARAELRIPLPSPDDPARRPADGLDPSGRSGPRPPARRRSVLRRWARRLRGRDVNLG